ncbi:MAG TPA: VOC family protein [Solirubrobacteraceae bacterium]
MPASLRIYETVIYASDVGATAAFYRDVLELKPIGTPPGFMAGFRLGDESVLLIFDPARSAVAGRDVPAHGTRGAGHLAFAVAPGSLEEWRTRLRVHSVEIEREVEWPRGGRSLYFRDPADTSVELVEGEIWR